MSLEGGHRHNRLQQLIDEEITSLLRDEAQDPRLADVRITGGDLLQTNGRAVAVSGITQLKFTANASSQGTAEPVQTNKGRLEQNGVDVSNQIVVYPGP